MGLDMFLHKTKKNTLYEDKTMEMLANDLYENKDLQDSSTPLSKVFEGLTYKYTQFDFVGEKVYLSKQIAYWRKANAIHKWFYDNCAKKGQEDNDNLTVEKEHLEKLRDICKEVFTYKDSILKQDKNYNTSLTKISELLPTQSGFFFGSLDYDEWYFEDIENTIKQIETILKETDFENEHIYYYASY